MASCQISGNQSNLFLISCTTKVHSEASGATAMHQDFTSYLSNGNPIQIHHKSNGDDTRHVIPSSFPKNFAKSFNVKLRKA
jgi:imidazoleglycerol phosphate dehydratase HisB